MAVQSIDVTGGESVYCFNQYQLTSAFELAESEGETGDRVREAISYLEDNFSRNERAAAAFLVIDHLMKSKDDASG